MQRVSSDACQLEYQAPPSATSLCQSLMPTPVNRAEINKGRRNCEGNC
ncbi:MAG: hypothetical protein U0175_07880 [Caldilineaceae bacterium]